MKTEEEIHLRGLAEGVTEWMVSVLEEGKGLVIAEVREAGERTSLGITVRAEPGVELKQGGAG